MQPLELEAFDLCAAEYRGQVQVNWETLEVRANG